MFFGLLVGFIVFITVRGQLQAYLQVLGLAPGGAAAAVTAPRGTQSPTYGGPGATPPKTIPYDPSIPVI